MSNRHNRYDRAALNKAAFTSQGFLKVPAFATRVGVFTYRMPDGTTVKEFRPPSEVFNSDSMKSLANVPVTRLHPKPGMIDAANAKSFTVGYTGDQVEAVDEKYLQVQITVIDHDTITEAGQGMQELSCGYVCEFDHTPGIYDGEAYDVVQKNIIYNHLAIVPRGRAGPEVKMHMDAEDAEMVVEDGGEGSGPQPGGGAKAPSTSAEHEANVKEKETAKDKAHGEWKSAKSAANRAVNAADKAKDRADPNPKSLAHANQKIAEHNQKAEAYNKAADAHAGALKAYIAHLSSKTGSKKDSELSFDSDTSFDSERAETMKEIREMAKMKIGEKEFDAAPEMAEAFEAHQKDMAEQMDAMQKQIDGFKAAKPEDKDSPESDKDEASEEQEDKKDADKKAPGAPDAEKANTDAMKKENETLKAKCDALSSDLSKLKETRSDSMSDGRIQALVKARMSVLSIAGRMLPASVKLDDMSDVEIKKAVIKADSPEVNFDGKSDEYVSARFDHIEERFGKVSSDRRDMGETIAKSRQDAGAQDSFAARARMMEEAKNAHKKPIGYSLQK